MVNVKELINKGRWDEIIKKLDHLELDSFIHLATINNQKDIINYSLNKNPKALELLDEDGNTPIHLMARYGLKDMMKKVFTKFPKLINLQNKKNQTPVHLMIKYDHPDHLEWVLNEIQNVNLNLADLRGHTPLHYAVRRSKKEGDRYYKILKTMLEENVDLTKPKSNPLLMESINRDKIHIVELILEKGGDPNIQNDKFLTALQLATLGGKLEISKLLIEKGADPNRVGPEGDQDPMMYSISKADEDMVMILLENGYNPNRHNRYLETSSHGVLSKNNFSPSLVAKILYLGDLNKQNVDGVTPLHLFLQNYNWRNYANILKKKKLDIFQPDRQGRTPMTYVQPQEAVPFLEMVTSSYIKQLKSPKMLIPSVRNQGCHTKKKLKSEQCLRLIREHIMNTKKSYPDEKDELELDQQFRLVEEKFNKDGRFNADTVHNMIYTVEMLKRHPEIGVPFQYAHPDKMFTDRMKTEILDLFERPAERIISDLVRIYSDFFYEIVPYLIVWRGEGRYFIHPDIEFYLLSNLRNSDIKYIFLKVTLVASSNGTHANMLLLDKEKRIFERFEPYGVVPYLENDGLDKLLKSRLVPFLEKELGGKIEYLSPKDYLDGSNFQVISNDSSLSVKKLGDPTGYCLAWTYWYLEMRISNPDVHPKKLVSKSVKKIIKTNNHVDGMYRFIDFIRSYAHRLDKMKNIFLRSVGVGSHYTYNIVMPKEEQEKIVIGLAKHFEKFVLPRYESKKEGTK